MLTGVAGGVGNALGVDPSIVRVLWVILVPISGGFMLLLYAVMVVVVPEEPMRPERIVDPLAASGTGGDPMLAADPQLASGADFGVGDDTPGLTRPQGATGILVGVLLMVVGGYLLVRQLFPELNLERFWPVALIAIGVVFVAASLRRDADRRP